MSTGSSRLEARGEAAPESSTSSLDRFTTRQRLAGRFGLMAHRLRSRSHELKARLDDLAELRKTLQTGDMIAAEWDLSLVAEEVQAIGTGLTAEGAALAKLIRHNALLSHQIDSVGGDIRFLAAIVSQARVAIASISEAGGDLDSFGRDLEALAVKAAQTLRDYGAEHAMLLDLLETTASRHKAFEDAAGARLLITAVELEAGAAELSRLRQHGDTTAGELCRGLQQVRDGLDQAAIHCGAADAAEKEVAEPGSNGPEPDTMLGKLVKQALACVEPHTGRHENKSPNPARAETPDGSGDRFLDKLGPKLNETRHLFEECREARSGVELLTEKVIPTFEVLNRMAENVTVMVTEIMISGTNAIVKSHRLGPQGAGLSVIAQHLRSHALRVADGINALAPLLATARALNSDFLETLNKNGTNRLSEISDRMGWVVESFVAVDRLSADVMFRVREETARLEMDLSRIAEELRLVTRPDEHAFDAI